jgi:hypothetical protein
VLDGPSRFCFSRTRPQFSRIGSLARRQTGQESLSFGAEQKRSSCLDELPCVIDWNEIDRRVFSVVPCLSRNPDNSIFERQIHSETWDCLLLLARVVHLQIHICVDNRFG